MTSGTDRAIIALPEPHCAIPPLQPPSPARTVTLPRPPAESLFLLSPDMEEVGLGPSLYYIIYIYLYISISILKILRKFLETEISLSRIQRKRNVLE